MSIKNWHQTADGIWINKGNDEEIRLVTSPDNNKLMRAWLCRGTAKIKPISKRWQTRANALADIRNFIKNPTL